MEPDGPAQQFNVPLNSRYFQVKADLAERTGAEVIGQHFEEFLLSC